MSVQLFEQQLSVVNVGLASFAEAIRDAKAPVVHLEWSPPAQGDRTVGMQLAELLVDKRVDAANQEAVSRLYAGQPILRGVAPAREVIPGIEDRMLLHAGPPIAWDAMSGPMQGAIIGAILFERWAATPDEARRLAAGGAIRLEPNHHHAAVGPMAGVTSPSMPVWIVENQTFGNRAFSSMNEGLGKVLRFGAYDDEVLGRLRWMRDVLGRPWPERWTLAVPSRSRRSSRKRCTWGMRCTTGMSPPPGCCSAESRQHWYGQGWTRATWRPCSSSSAGTITFSSTCRWRPARRCSMLPMACPPAAW